MNNLSEKMSGYFVGLLVGFLFLVGLNALDLASSVGGMITWVTAYVVGFAIPVGLTYAYFRYDITAKQVKPAPVKRTPAKRTPAKTTAAKAAPKA